MFIWTVCLAVLSGVVYALFIHDLHESTLAFSTLDEIEQEVSLRGDAAFFYSFYKQLSSQPFFDSLHNLTTNIQVQYPNSVNVLARFNIYQVRCFCYH